VAAAEAPSDDTPPSRPRFDGLTEALIPAAVFGLLGSFLYYLIDLRGALGDPGISGLRWVCFWFLLGTILTTRMRTRYGANVLALPYMIGLALAMVLFVFHVTMYSGPFAGSRDALGQVVALVFNYALVGLIWWVAGLVTRACTAEEAFQAMADEGLLTAVRRGSRAKGRPRHPGWVLMWTSIAALVTFALGQQLVGGGSGELRRHAFLCMVAYSFFALVLLALTSLSALRMSARERRIQVASSIAPTWTLASVAIVATILAMAALLPRVRAVERVRHGIARVQGWREPPETTWDDGPAMGVRRPHADPGGEHRANQDEGSARGVQGDESGQHPQDGEEGRPTPSGGAGGDEAGKETPGGSDSASGDSGGTGSEGGGGGGGQGESGKSGEQRNGEQKQGEQAGTSQPDEQPSQSGGAANQGSGDQQQQTAASGSQEGDEAAQPSGKPQTRTAGTPDLLKQLLLWLLILLGLLLLLLLLAYLIYRALKNRKQLPSFRGWLQSIWALTREALADAWARVTAAVAAVLAFLARLVGWRPRVRLKADGLPEDPFTDIFASRELAGSLTPAQVVKHVYAAFQAFADLIGYGRQDDQTPYEFCRALPKYIGGMPQEDADALTALYVKAAYSPHEIGDDEVGEARLIWDHMQAPIDEALANRGRPPARAA
jgi:uncharacterized membrane protein YgcG